MSGARQVVYSPPMYQFRRIELIKDMQFKLSRSSVPSVWMENMI